MLQNARTLAIGGLDTGENGQSKVRSGDESNSSQHRREVRSSKRDFYVSSDNAEGLKRVAVHPEIIESLEQLESTFQDLLPERYSSDRWGGNRLVSANFRRLTLF